MTPLISNLITQRARFLAFVQKRVRDAATAEDILQSAYARAIAQADSLQTDTAANAWFFRILRNAVIDHYRHNAVETRTFEPIAPGTDPQATIPDMAPANTCPCLTSALHQLQPGYEGILRQVDLNEVPLETYAKDIGITPGNAAVRAHRARRSLRKKLVDRCGSCAEAGCLDCTCRSTAARHG